MNPYLPAGEYIPDAEPYIFGDRVYIYGSHDKFGAPIFCVGDYVCWSAPVSDLTDWRYEGVIYKKNQDPKNKLGLRLLFAPDVCQ
nr:alpha-N-arabinofuranosidase [Alloscardovia omnicolens]